jgi:hypothetical protein
MKQDHVRQRIDLGDSDLKSCGRDLPSAQRWLAVNEARRVDPIVWIA